MDELIKTCINGDLKKVKYLVSKGADIHAYHDSALRWAARNGHLEVVKYLVEHGADVHANNNDALRWAVWNGQQEVVLYLREVAGNEWRCYDCIVRATCLSLCEGWNKNG